MVRRNPEPLMTSPVICLHSLHQWTDLRAILAVKLHHHTFTWSWTSATSSTENTVRKYLCSWRSKHWKSCKSRFFVFLSFPATACFYHSQKLNFILIILKVPIRSATLFVFIWPLQLREFATQFYRLFVNILFTWTAVSHSVSDGDQ